VVVPTESAASSTPPPARPGGVAASPGATIRLTGDVGSVAVCTSATASCELVTVSATAGPSLRTRCGQANIPETVLPVYTWKGYVVPFSAENGAILSCGWTTTRASDRPGWCPAAVASSIVGTPSRGAPVAEWM